MLDMCLVTDSLWHIFLKTYSRSINIFNNFAQHILKSTFPIQSYKNPKENMRKK